MPAPAGPQLMGTVLAGMPPNQIGHPQFQKFVRILTAEISLAWTQFALSCKWGKTTVSGAGIGGWVGTGTLGLIVPGAFVLNPMAIKAQMGSLSPDFDKLILNLSTTITPLFTLWASTYKFTSIPYTGTSGASPLSPGPISAKATPTPLGIAGKGTDPMGIANMWNVKLSSPEGGRPFNVFSPFCRVKDLTKAVGSAIETEFTTTFLMTTMCANDTFTGSGLPGSGTPVPPAISVGDGVLI